MKWHKMEETRKQIVEDGKAGKGHQEIEPQEMSKVAIGMPQQS